MDPDATLAEIRAIIRDERHPDWTQLAVLIDALDEWLSRGGFLPQAWRPETRDAALREAARAAEADVLGEVDR